MRTRVIPNVVRDLYRSSKDPSALGLGMTMVLVATSAFAANGIDVSRGPDRVEFGNCVPSLTVDNRSGETIDYLQVDLVMALADGQERIVELKSAYREGVHLPIAPGATATLKQQLDLERALGVPCGDLKARKVGRTICEVAGGKACASSVSVRP